MEILVSIITVTFNSEKFLEQTIQSVINQTYKNIEYIIIDGGSTDGTVEIIKKNKNHINYWISEKDNGISNAFNKGIAQATGNIVGIINSDDWYELDVIEKIVKNYSKGDVLHGKIQYWKNGDIKDYVFTGNHAFLKKEMTINHMTAFVKREIYLKWGDFDEKYKYAMDYELMLRFYMNGVHFYYLPDILANMRLDGASDKNWKKAAIESYDAKIKNGILKAPALLYLNKIILRTSIRKLIQGSPLNFILVLYRKYFALLQKV